MKPKIKPHRGREIREVVHKEVDPSKRCAFEEVYHVPQGQCPLPNQIIDQLRASKKISLWIRASPRTKEPSGSYFPIFRQQDKYIISHKGIIYASVEHIVTLDYGDYFFSEELDRSLVSLLLLSAQLFLDLQDLRQQLLLCLLETHDLQAAALVLFRGRLQLLLVFELLKGVVEVVVQSAFLYTAARKHLPQELGERQVVLLLPLGVSLGVEFLPAQLGEAGREQLVVLKDFVFILWLEVDLRQIHGFRMVVMKNFQKAISRRQFLERAQKDVLLFQLAIVPLYKLFLQLHNYYKDLNTPRRGESK